MPDVFFSDEPEVIARLTYKPDGTPIALLGGKKRDRDKDMELLVTWLRAMFKVVHPDDETASAGTDQHVGTASGREPLGAGAHADPDLHPLGVEGEEQA